MYDRAIIEALKNFLIAQQQTIAVAESVTGGHLQAAISSAENASKFFRVVLQPTIWARKPGI